MITGKIRYYCAIELCSKRLALAYTIDFIYFSPLVSNLKRYTYSINRNKLNSTQENYL